MYTFAFAFRPFKAVIGFGTLFVGLAIGWFFSKLIESQAMLLKHISLTQALMVYVIVTCLTTWRGLVMWQKKATASTGQAVTGVIMLVVADIVVAIDMLISPFGIQGAHLWIMLNTFLGTFLIGNSVLIECETP